MSEIENAVIKYFVEGARIQKEWALEVLRIVGEMFPEEVKEARKNPKIKFYRYGLKH